MLSPIPLQCCVSTYGSIFVNTAVAVLCGLGKSRLISGVYPEQFELSPSNNDGLKTRRNPESTNYR